jgi:hypothetical protein
MTGQSSASATSGWVVLGGLAVALVMVTFAVDVGAEWYDVGRLRLCLPSDGQPFLTGQRPLPTEADEDGPDYWCASTTIREVRRTRIRWEEYAQLKRRYDEDVTKNPAAMLDRQANFEQEGGPQPPLSPADEETVQEAEGILLSPEPFTYSGFWGDSVIDREFRDAFRDLYKFGVGHAGSPFTDYLAPAWNDYFAVDSRVGADRRNVVWWVAVTIGAAFLVTLVTYTFSWINQVALSKARSRRVER